MTKAGIFLVAVALALGAAYLFWFTDLFVKPTIQILAQVRPGTISKIPRFDDTTVWPVSFAFDKKYQLTEVTVVSADEANKNKFPHALWHLISDSNSVPVKALIYGSAPPKGMKPKTPKARPEPLEPGVRYRLIVHADNYEGHVDFKTREAVQPHEK